VSIGLGELEESRVKVGVWGRQLLPTTMFRKEGTPPP